MNIFILTDHLGGTVWLELEMARDLNLALIFLLKLFNAHVIETEMWMKLQDETRKAGGNVMNLGLEVGFRRACWIMRKAAGMK